jgi:hypothetical protein
LYGVFELPLPRNARKRTKKLARKTKSFEKPAGGWVGLGFSKYTGGAVDFLGGPSLCLLFVPFGFWPFFWGALWALGQEAGRQSLGS